MNAMNEWWAGVMDGDAFARMTAADFRVCLVLWRHQRRGQVVAITSEDLAKQSSIAAVGTVSRTVRRLAKLGLIEILQTGTRSRPAAYLILKPRNGAK